MSLSGPQGSSTPAGTARLLRLLLLASLIVPMLAFAGAAWQERRVLMGEAARRAEKAAEVLEQHAGAAFHAYELIFASATWKAGWLPAGTPTSPGWMTD